MARVRGGSRPRIDSSGEFPAGAEVEVRSNEERSRGVWYEARIVRHKPRRRRYEVVYSLLADDDNPSHPLRELVRHSNIRPRPPPLPVSQAHYSLHDVVEAFHKNGWWSGIVAALFPGPPSTAYLVFFPTCREEHAFEASYLRPQLHWRSGDWVPAAQQVDLPASTKRKNKRLQSRSTRRSTRRKWKSQTGERCSPILVIISSDEGEHTCESDFVKLTSLESFQPCKNMITMSLEYNNTLECNLLIDCPSTSMAEIDTSMKIIENNSSREQHHPEGILPPYVLPDNPLYQPQLQDVNGGAANESQEVNNASCDYQLKETQLNASPDSPAMNSLPKLKEREDEGTSDSHVNSRKRKFKVLTHKPTHQNKAAKDDGVDQHAEDENGRRDDSSSCLFSDSPQQLCQQNNILENLLVQSLPDIASSSYETPVSCGTMDSVKCCIEGLSVPSKVGEVLTEIHQRETPLETTIDDEGVQIVPRPSEPPESEILLPFSRTSAMWQSIESMEVFRLMPQNPHFRLLEQYAMEFREGMAIGLMVSFANLVTNIKLHIDDTQYTLEEKMRVLVLLEENGFDVSQLRSWLQKLLEMHHNRRQFEARKALVEEKIAEKKADNDRLQSSITSVDNTIMELEQNLTSAHKTKDSAILQKSLNNAEISKLEMSIREIEKSFNSTEASWRATNEISRFS